MMRKPWFFQSGCSSLSSLERESFMVYLSQPAFGSSTAMMLSPRNLIYSFRETKMVWTRRHRQKLRLIRIHDAGYRFFAA
jgi:hypothetical protein